MRRINEGRRRVCRTWQSWLLSGDHDGSVISDQCGSGCNKHRNSDMTWDVNNEATLYVHCAGVDPFHRLL